MRLIWYTRGWAWGGRFLADAGLEDPLPTFEDVVDRLSDLDETWTGPTVPVGLRMLDPEGRKDRSGRPIVHEIAILDELPDGVTDFDTAREWVWSLIGPTYDELWASGPDSRRASAAR